MTKTFIIWLLLAGAALAQVKISELPVVTSLGNDDKFIVLPSGGATSAIPYSSMGLVTLGANTFTGAQTINGGGPRLNFPISLAPYQGQFQFHLGENVIAVGNPYDAGRTFADGVTTSGSALIKSAALAIFNAGDINRAVSGTGIPASTRILSIPRTTIGSSSNLVALPQSTINVAATSSFTATTGNIQVLTNDGYQTVAYTGKSSTTFTGCTGGTGTMLTGGTVVSKTEAVMTANATASATVTITIAGKSDSPFSWGFNSPSSPNYVASDAFMTYTIEPTYTTAGGVRQMEHYLTVGGEGEGGDRVFAVNWMLYGGQHALNTATANFYYDTSVFGNKNNYNDAITFMPAVHAADDSNLSFGNGSKIAFATSRRDYITDGSGSLLGDQVAKTTIASGSNAANVNTATTINVASAASFPSSGRLTIATNNGNQYVAYTGKGATTFTGCTPYQGAVTTGLMATGGVVYSNTASGTGRVMASKLTTTIGADLSDGVNDITLYLGDPTTSYYSGLRFDHTTVGLQYINAGGSWSAPIGQWSTSLGVGLNGTGTPAATLVVDGGAIRIEANADPSIYFQFARIGSGRLEFSGSQSTYAGYTFKTPSVTDAFGIGCNGLLSVSATNTAALTTGAQTINKAAGTVNFAASASTLVVTNSLVTTSSIVFAVVRTGDTTAAIKNVIPANGSFTITLSAAATAETSVGFLVINGADGT